MTTTTDELAPIRVERWAALTIAREAIDRGIDESELIRRALNALEIVDASPRQHLIDPRWETCPDCGWYTHRAWLAHALTGFMPDRCQCARKEHQ